MKLLIPALVFILFACNQVQQANTTGNKGQNINDERCKRFYDSMLALANTPVTVDEISLYTHLYTKKEIQEDDNHLTYNYFSFHTGDKSWDMQLDTLLNNMAQGLIGNWRIRQKEFKKRAALTKTNYEDYFHSVEIIPYNVSHKWITIGVSVSTYSGGVHPDWEGWFLHFMKGDDGAMQEIRQPDIFIYDKDSSIKYRYYHTILKGMDTEINCGSIKYVPTCLDKQFFCDDVKHQITFNYFVDPENVVSRNNPYAQEFYLVPTKKGLKTKTYTYYGDARRYEMFPDFQSDYIIPYKNLKGIVKAEYLTIWQNSN